MKTQATDYTSLEERIRELQDKLEEATSTLDAIRNGQVDAFVVNNTNGPSLYTLKSADHAYRIFIEKMTEGAVTLNSEGLIVYCNSKFASVVNRPLQSVIGSYFGDFVTDDCKPTFESIFRRSWEQSSKSEIFLTCDGHQVPVQLSMNALQNDHEGSLNIIVTDLSIQKENQKELEGKNELLKELNQALSTSNHDLQQFASVASHDLQEPIRKIQVYSRLLKDNNVEGFSETSRVYLEKIITSAARMKALIVDILSYSRLSADDSRFELTDLNLLFEDVIEGCELRILEKGAIVELGDLPSIEVNQGQMRQVFTNLVSNSLKFVKDGVVPRITIESRKLSAKEVGLSLTDEQAYCRIVIKDNGIGFDERFASSIFSLFEKLNPKSSFEGSGIGLAIAKKIVDKHHGMIIAKSREGVGSEFNIILPRRRVISNGH
jgi:signal transduction histidine kinase